MIGRAVDRDKQPNVDNDIGREHSSRLMNGPAGPDVTVFGEAMVTSPAPARNAPRAASRAAPVEDIPPETTTACPRVYL